MKKLQVIAAVMVLLIAAGNKASAQTKIGYIRIDDIVGVMPDLQKINIDTVGDQFLKDSVAPKVERLQSEYNRKLQDYLDTVKNSKAVRELIARELEDMRNELSGVDGYVQQVRQFKQQEFLKPYYKRAKDAIDVVAKKGGYTHILSSDIFLVAPDADDLSVRVLSELKIDLPKPQGTQPKPNTGTTPGGAKPAGKTN
jgi:outer membrane protein